MRINALKYVCFRFGASYDAYYANLTMKNGESITRVTTLGYLGVHFVSGRV